MLLKTARKIVVAVIGFTVVLLGVAMIVTPGPAIVVIPLGLAILGTEFVWARRMLRRVKSGARKMMGKGPEGGEPCCRKCGLVLTGNAGETCPECGDVVKTAREQAGA